ncbi:NUDIX hydrolase [Candidatus Berkelbacteria bacterium]|nr:NUDIX hydrolase [Candidatus Berkelbacteria bacterium]
MPPKPRTGRAVVVYPYTSRKKPHKTYGSILLSLERASGKYSLPGGGIEPRKGDRDSRDAALRELKEEYGRHLRITPWKHDPKTPDDWAPKLFTFEGHRLIHDVYLLQAEGSLRLDQGELMGLGFFNAGSHNQIPSELLERMVREGLIPHLGNLREYGWKPSYDLRSERFPFPSPEIDRQYRAGKTGNPYAISWDEQHRLWEAHGTNVFQRESVLQREGYTRARPDDDGRREGMGGFRPGPR